MDNLATRSTQSPRWISLTGLIVAIASGGFALLIVLAHLTIPIPGTDIVTDPREIFVIIGSAISGPIGAVIIGVLAGIGIANFPLASIAAHIVGALTVSLVYPMLHRRFSGAAYYLACSGLIFAYYYVLLMPVFLISRAVLYPGNSVSLQMYIQIAGGAWNEVLLTMLITLLVAAIMPGRFRKPLWGKSG